ncbi:transglutaminaseTgpA domain-containing protein [Micromonospora sonneratiae]|uniref:TransglutaminaseTgpA domain-containing protein n=1 Tax=Micromonospora sonneratiae TaxID=1184706 RepID=A0ABW3YGQ7_9ACTN
MVRLLRIVPVPLTMIVMIGLAGVVLGQVYSDQLLTQLVVGAAIGSVAVSLAARRLPSWLVAPLSVVALAGYAAFALWFTAQRAELPGSFGTVALDAIRNGIPRLLTAMIPAEPVPDTVIVPLVAAWLAGLAGAEVAMRAGRVLLGYLPAALLYVGSLYVVGPNADPAIWPTVAFAGAVAIGLATNGRAGTTPTGATSDASAAAVPAAVRARMAAGSAAGLVGVIGLVTVVAPVVAGQVGGVPVDPRRYVQPPQVDSLDENPLIRISGWALNPGQKLFDVRTTVGGPADDAPQPGEAAPDGGRSDPVRIRLAVLSDYDGATWRVGATYRNAGRVLPTVPQNPLASVVTVQQEIVVGDLSGRLLPAVPAPRQVTGARVAYDPDSGTLIRPEGLSPGLRYEVTSAREQPDLSLLTAANVPSGNAVARVLRVADGAPEQLRRLAEQLAAENGAPYSRALAIEQFLAEHYRVVADAPSGHAYPNLGFFLFGPRNGGGQRGTSEQFAAAFAVLGRLMGLPTRVVVGFSSATGNGPVRAADAFAWPEVLFDELGWVAFDPMPQPDTDPRPVEEDFRPRPEEPPPTPDEAVPSAEPTEPTSPGQAAPPQRDGGIPVPVLAGGGSATLILLVAGSMLSIVALRRAQRRRRLTVGAPQDRVAGAWREVTDALRLAGAPVSEHLAAGEVVTHARSVLDGAPGPTDTAPDTAMLRPSVPPIEELAELVNLSGFAPGATTEEQARRAGDHAVAYATALRARRSWWRRLLWSTHPGPLRWRR